MFNGRESEGRQKIEQLELLNILLGLLGDIIVYLYKIRPENIEDFITDFMGLGDLPVPT
jgi:hypothetical protein